MLVRLQTPEFPVVFGVVRDVVEPTYDHGLLSQIDAVTKASAVKNMDELLMTGETWEIK
jgi:2-oxoglutarate ferredoxin oxidoreductase subunit beta